MDSTGDDVAAVRDSNTDISSEYEEVDVGRKMSNSIACRGAHQNNLLYSRSREMPLLKPSQCPPRSRRKYGVAPFRRGLSTLFLFLTLVTLLPRTNAVFINFDNCLDLSIRNSGQDGKPQLLQFVPLWFWAEFNTSAPSHNLNITIYGNVTGQATEGAYPPPNSESWSNPNETFGKIVDVSPTNPKFSTLFSNFEVLTYTAFNAQPSEFCLSTVNTACPLSPVFPGHGDANDPHTLRGFTVAHEFYSSYSFATFSSTIRVDSGDAGAPHLACVSSNITPDLGNRLSAALRYMPAAVLLLVGVATIFAATCSPWGTSDLFRWSSNYGRDEDLLRLVTPGFGDCLQYIQFIVLAGSLNLSYPGYYQPVVSQAGWSLLLFNESIVSHGNGSHALVDGIYFANGTYGLSRLGQLVGMSEEQDIWAGMAIWLLGLIAIIVVLTQFAFAIRWIHRLLANTQGGDLRNKNWPFTAGNIVRMVFNFFLLPIIAISLFQMVVAGRSPASVVAMAVVLLLGVITFAVWIFWFIFTTRPRAHLFDDLPTVLTYGPLYNTYSDDAAPFAFIPVLLTTVRGIAIGAIQPSGIAQLVMLAICEVILILTLHAFRPFQSNTSMNAYHTFFSAVRLVTTLLMTAFAPTLGVSEAAKGWIGYAILLLHAIVLVFGFFLNALQTIIEVAARLIGAGGDARGGLTKVFGKRELSKRARHRRNQRSSLNSNAAMLAHDGDAKSFQLQGGRSRSLSASSAALLNQHLTNSQRGSIGFDQNSQGGDFSNYGGTSPGTPGTGATPFSVLGSGSGSNSRRPTMGTMGTLDNADPYYRPPRPRKNTMEMMNAPPGARNRASGASSDLANVQYADSPEQAEAGDAGEGPSSWSPNQQTSITPAYLRMHRDGSDPNLAERRNNTDYSVRESDFYYGLRGPALSDQPTRKLKTGPADPMGPVSSATGWFKTFFGGKRKEKGKGFEVVRSTRMPPQMMPVEEDDESPPIPQEPYRDHPGTPSDSKKSPDRTSPGGAIGAAVIRRSIESDSDNDSEADPFDHRMQRISDIAPTLGPIETGGGIELPSRIGSKASRNAPSRAPTLPRKSSKRPKSTDRAVLETSNRLSTVMASPPGTPGRMSALLGSDPQGHLQPNPTQLPVRLPFGSSEPSPSPERSTGNSAASSIYRNDAASDFTQLGTTEDLVPPQNIPGGTPRPLSTGYVHHHLARDSIRGDDIDAGGHLEASAEFFDGRSKSISTQRSGGSGRS